MVGIELRRAGCRWRVTKPAVSIASWVLISSWGFDGGFFLDRDHSWRREDYGHRKGIQDTGVLDKERRTRDLAG